MSHKTHFCLRICVWSLRSCILRRCINLKMATNVVYAMLWSRKKYFWKGVMQQVAHATWSAWTRYCYYCNNIKGVVFWHMWSGVHIRINAISCGNTMFRHQTTCRTRLRRRKKKFWPQKVISIFFRFWVKMLEIWCSSILPCAWGGRYANSTQCINHILVSQPLYM